MKTIQDEFTHLTGTVSRQRILHLRRKRDGLCILCSQPRHPSSASYCEKHHLAARKQHRAFCGNKAEKPDSEIECRKRVAARIASLRGLVDAWH